jgi:hypothetical protein
VLDGVFAFNLAFFCIRVSIWSEKSGLEDGSSRLTMWTDERVWGILWFVRSLPLSTILPYPCDGILFDLFFSFLKNLLVSSIRVN